MTTPQNDGGPVFPVPPDQAYATGMSLCEGTAVCAAGTGMTLRDYFAGQFIQGGDPQNFDISSRHEVAKYAYMMADAMLAASIR
jgi:hypothetical protein